MKLVEIGRRIRSARRALGLTQTEVADRAGVSRTTFTKLELGTLSEIGYVKLQSILAVVRMDLTAVERNPPAEKDGLTIEKLVAKRKLDPKGKAREKSQFKAFEHVVLSSSQLSAERIAGIVRKVKQSGSFSIEKTTNHPIGRAIAAKSLASRPTLNDLLTQRSAEREARYRVQSVPPRRK